MGCCAVDCVVPQSCTAVLQRLKATLESTVSDADTDAVETNCVQDVDMSELQAGYSLSTIYLINFRHFLSFIHDM